MCIYFFVVFHSWCIFVCPTDSSPPTSENIKMHPMIRSLWNIQATAPPVDISNLYMTNKFVQLDSSDYFNYDNVLSLFVTHKDAIVNHTEEKCIPSFIIDKNMCACVFSNFSNSYFTFNFEYILNNTDAVKKLPMLMVCYIALNGQPPQPFMKHKPPML